MSCLSITNLPLAGLKKIERKRFSDSRGFLERLFCAGELREIGWDKPIAQMNLTQTVERGTVRGMHFQFPPHAEMKIVSCIHGEVWDVAIDLRKESPTFLKWYAQRLSSENLTALLIPEGFAHGFQTITENAELVYIHSRSYEPSAEGGINPCDSSLAIDWPLPIAKISERDNSHPMINENFEGIQI